MKLFANEFVDVAFVVVAFVVESAVSATFAAVRLVTFKFVAAKFVDVPLVKTNAVPVALVNVSVARSANDVSCKLDAESPAAKVDVPEPADTVIAPPNVEVAVPVAIKLRKMVWPYNVVDANAALVVADNVEYVPIAFANDKFVVKKLVVVALVKTSAVPVAFVKVNVARSANEVSCKLDAESPPANVDVP
jgi:hypothetical protein